MCICQGTILMYIICVHSTWKYREKSMEENKSSSMSDMMYVLGVFPPGNNMVGSVWGRGGARSWGSAQWSLQRCSLGPAIQLRAGAGESHKWRACECSSVLLRGTCGLGLNVLARFGLFQWLHCQGQNFQCHHLIMWLFSLYPGQGHWLLL